jgi:hypothetical protein
MPMPYSRLAVPLAAASQYQTRDLIFIGGFLHSVHEVCGSSHYAEQCFRISLIYANPGNQSSAKGFLFHLCTAGINLGVPILTQLDF